MQVSSSNPVTFTCFGVNEPNFAPLVARLQHLAEILSTRGAQIQLAIQRLRGEGGTRDPIWQDPLERRATVEKIAAEAGVSAADLMILLYLIEKT